MTIKDRVVYWFYLAHFRYAELRESLHQLFLKHRPRFLSSDEHKMMEERGCMLDAFDRRRATIQARCNHKKGGLIRNMAEATPGQISKALYNGSASQYSVIKHQHITGDIWITCLRCGKKWKPPIRSEYKTEREFYRAVEEYETAIRFETNNSTSTSVICQFKLNGNIDAGLEYVRKQMANS